VEKFKFWKTIFVDGAGEWNLLRWIVRAVSTFPGA